MKQTLRGEYGAMKKLREIMLYPVVRRGLGLILALGILLALHAFYPANAAEPTADEIVAKALAARGGVKKLKAIQSQRITGVLYFSP
jgi:hypothetical protein